ncbi:MAG: hypothetical protein LBS73_06295 [Campylobacteraceae bacterium]|jgi:YaeC family lipoprotein|nr:hypothetical protein [Campylobacteraceae bacterium]
MSETNANFEIKKRSSLLWIVLVVAVLLIAGGVFYYVKSQRSGVVTFGDTLKVHYEPAEAGEEHILKFISEHIAPDYGIKIEAVGLQDDILGNTAVAEGEFAGSIYEHQWYLKQLVEAHGLELTAVLPVFQWSFGIYSLKHNSIKELPDGALIAIPVDIANQGQALWLLAREGLIEINPQVEPRIAKIRDISSNPHNFKFKELDFLTLPRILDSVDASIGYIGNFDAGKIPRERGIFFPPVPKTFASQLVIGTKYLDDPQIKKLIAVFKDKRLDEYLRTTDDPLVQGVYTAVSQN